TGRSVGLAAASAFLALTEGATLPDPALTIHTGRVEPSGRVVPLGRHGRYDAKIRVVGDRTFVVPTKDTPLAEDARRMTTAVATGRIKPVGRVSELLPEPPKARTAPLTLVLAGVALIVALFAFAVAAQLRDRTIRYFPNGPIMVQRDAESVTQPAHVRVLAGVGYDTPTTDLNRVEADQVRAPTVISLAAFSDGYWVGDANRTLWRVTADRTSAVRPQISLNDMAALPDGWVAVLDQESDTIYRVSGAGDVEILAGTAGAADTRNDTESATAAATETVLEDAHSLLVDADGSVVVSERGRIRRVRDGTIETIAGSGDTAYVVDGSPAVNAPIGCPGDLAVD
ncbi:MAG: hypothetical protein GY704_09895, partial [Phycisphaeraceae bacterium]|nr:hypothetical protein [Phycisphaeraceae bacterium]